MLDTLTILTENKILKDKLDKAIKDIPRCCYYCSFQDECDAETVYEASECKSFKWRGLEDNKE